ncbi:MAG TPA: MFS transporter [Nocardioidaceae bacterium]|nr:MFS transporter [Nocardioidaceae bacterium]
MAAVESRSNRTQVVLGLVVACTAHFLVGADGLAVAIALPTMQSELQVAPIDAQWVLTAYGLAFGGALLLGGRLGDLYGRRRLLVTGMTLFAAGSLLAGASPSLEVLVCARAIQGLGAAAAIPATLALIGTMFGPGTTRTRALSLLAAMASVGISTGMLLGGIVTELLGWRWVFLLVVPFPAAAAVLAPRVLPESRAERIPRRLDVGGAVLVSAGFVAILLGLTRVEHDGLASASTVVPALTGLVLLVAFVGWERRSPVPLVRVQVLRVRALRAATLGVGVNAVAFTCIVYVGTLYLQTALGYGPLSAGLALLPITVVAFAVPVLAGRRLARHSPRRLLAASFAATAAALLWLARAPVPADYATDLMLPLVVLGASLSIAFVVLNQEAIADVAPDDKGVASGVFETANHLFGGAVGVAAYATVLTATASHPGDPDGYRAAFILAAGGAVVLGSASALIARRQARTAGGYADPDRSRRRSRASR